MEYKSEGLGQLTCAKVRDHKAKKGVEMVLMTRDIQPTASVNIAEFVGQQNDCETCKETGFFLELITGCNTIPHTSRFWASQFA